MSTAIKIILGLVAVLVLCVVSALVGYNSRKKFAEKEIGSAEDEAKKIINEAIKSAEAKKRETVFEAKEEIHKERTELEREIKERRSEMSKQERRLQQKEETLDRKNDSLDKKNETLRKKIADAEATQAEIEKIKLSQVETLERISGYTVDEAKAMLVAQVESEVTHEMAMKVKEVEERA
ncbi:MAG: DUF3552 domain-containing protein, partial [Oscillospiraceae bacterium]|nr:DUF3552 domain-containing protein [Oscillospiraceae bacterium]